MMFIKVEFIFQEIYLLMYNVWNKNEHIVY